jgi:hypothetical protein
MKPGWYMRDGMKVVQKMVDGGKNIGIKKVLEARGLWPEGKFLLKCKDGCAPGRTDCCARTLLANQPDFLEQECALAERLRQYNETNGTNHLIDFLPKFHPELNPIERYWASLKRMLQCATILRVLQPNTERRSDRHLSAEFRGSSSAATFSVAYACVVRIGLTALTRSQTL